MSGAASVPVVSIKDYGPGKAGVAKRWIAELDLAEKETRSWEQRVINIEKRYRDERDNTDQGALRRGASSYRFNVLWSNVQTLMPAIYARPPKPVVGRRYRDRDPVGRAASQILERGLNYQIECGDLHGTVKQAVQDFLLGGRGVVWMVYEPKYAPVAQDAELSDATETGAIETDTPIEGQPTAEADVQIDSDGDKAAPAYEEVECDYVYWKDFQVSPSRTWKEVRWVARRVYMTRDELRERFKKLDAQEINSIPLDWRPSHLTDQDVTVEQQAFERAVIWEIWDKPSRKVVWICQGYSEKPLDERDDPLNLEGFFPCPRPLFATMTNGTLIPVPDYAEYQDQADQLDDLTGRIAMVTKVVKVAGLYPSAETDVQRLFNEGVENQLLPVTNWPQFMEAGGLDKMLAMIPTEKNAAVLRDLTEIRGVIKNDLYEVTGIADIIRGSTQANETATAQQIKGRYATMRLSDKQGEVARFVRDILRMMAEIMCEHFAPETLLLMSDYDQSDDPGPEGVQKTAAAIQLLRDDKVRGFRIDIEDESTIAQDDQEDKQSRTDFITAVSAFLQQAIPAVQAVPELGELLGKMLLFAVRGFRVGRDMETTIEDALAQLQKAQKEAQGQPKPPTPEQIQAQSEQAKMQADLQKTQMDAEAEGMKAQTMLAIEKLKMEAQENDAQRKHEFDMASLHLQLVQAQHQQARELEKSQRERETMDQQALTDNDQTSEFATRLDQLEGGLMEVAKGIGEGQKAIIEKIGELGKAA